MNPEIDSLRTLPRNSCHQYWPHETTAFSTAISLGILQEVRPPNRSQRQESKDTNLLIRASEYCGVGHDDRGRGVVVVVLGLVLT